VVQSGNRLQDQLEVRSYTYVSIVFLPLLCPPPLGQTVRGVLCEYGEYMAARGSNGWIEGGWNAHLDERPIGIEGWCVMYA